MSLASIPNVNDIVSKHQGANGEILEELLPALTTSEDVTGLHGRIRFKHTDELAKRDANYLDNERKQLQAYEYLCHIGEAKEWIEACIKTEIPPIDKLEEELRNGIDLAYLAKFFSPESVVKKIYEDRSRLVFKHSDNINFLFNAMNKIGLPEVFLFELTDLYDKKNIPKVIYCIHALAHLLHKKGLAPSINNLVGKLTFTDEQLDATSKALDESGISMPAFHNIGNALAKEMNELTDEQKRQMWYEENEDKVIVAQNTIRAILNKKQLQQQLDVKHHNEAVRAENLLRMVAARNKYLARLEYFKAHEKEIITIQSIWRGYQARKLYNKLRAEDLEAKRLAAEARDKFYKDNLDKIILAQSLIRGALERRNFKALLNAQDTDIRTLKNYIKLWADQAADIEDELNLEKLRALVVKKIRENIALEGDVNDLDVKISLLVRNRISLEEVVNFTAKKMRKELAEQATKEQEQGFDLRGKDKESREKREHYEQLFYLLQTQPHYLANLMFTLNKTSGGSATKFLDQVVLTMYGYAQNTREEYILLTLIKECIKVEIDDIAKLDEFWRANPFFIKLVLHYTRGAKNSQFLRDLLSPIITEMLEDRDLDLETDAMGIYKALIREDELRTGEKSQRKYDATLQEVQNDADVQKIQSAHVKKLTQITARFVSAIVSSLKNMPFGIRCIAKEMREVMTKKFPKQDEEVLKAVGNLIYYRYMNPAIVAPEAFDVITSNQAITPTQRRNLAEVAKLLQSVSVKKLFSTDDQTHSTLNTFIDAEYTKLRHFFKETSSVESAEEYFGTDALADAGLKTKPTIYISPEEVFQIHNALLQNYNDLKIEKDSPLNIILNDLGKVPPYTAGVQSKEVALHLTNRFPTIEDQKEGEIKKLVTETKRMVITIIQCQQGLNLLSLLESPSTDEAEKLFKEISQELIRQEKANRELINQKMKSRMSLHEGKSTADLKGEALQPPPRVRKSRASATTSSPGTSPISPASINSAGSPFTSVTNLNVKTGSLLLLNNGQGGFFNNFREYKARALENMDKLEKEGIVSQKDGYQSMLNELAKDILTKHRRRERRQKELATLQQTLENLKVKQEFLSEQKTSYHDYINACMSQLGTKKKASKKPLLFSRQYMHMRQLQKTGAVPKFGSFKFSASELHKKGVLVSLEGVSPKQYGQITLTISSDEAGVFLIEASFFGVKLPDKYTVRLEDLLTAQYDGVDVMDLFDGAKVNVNLMVFLLNKKFYV